MLADFGLDGDGHDRLVDFSLHHDLAGGLTIGVPLLHLGESLPHAVWFHSGLLTGIFAKLKDWRRIATRYDRCAHTSFSAICIAATVIFWINESSGNLWLLPSELKDGSHFWLSKAEGRKQP